MVYMNSVSTLWSEGAFMYELVLRICAFLAFVHAWKRGYFPWMLSIFCIGTLIESLKGDVYCKTESLLMIGPCQEIGLHACFWTVWFYPCTLAVFRLGLPKWCRPFAIGLLTQVNGLPFDLGGSAAGMWQFSTKALNNGSFVATTLYPGAFKQHLLCGLGCGIVIELLLRKGTEIDSEFGYPKLSCCKQVIAPFGTVLFWLSASFIPFGYRMSLIACGLVFIYGLTKRRTPACMEPDWMLLYPPTLVLFCHLSYTAVHILNGFLVTPEPNMPAFYGKHITFTTSQCVTSIVIQGACIIVFLAIVTLAVKEVKAPSTYSLMA